MSEQNDAELTTLAAALAQMRPRPPALDRDGLMFRAGQASAPRGWKWPLATVASTLVAIGLGIALLVRPQPPIVVRTEYVEVIVPAPEMPAPESKPTPALAENPALVSHEVETSPPMSDYQRLQDHLLRWGFDGLPPAQQTPVPQQTPEKLLRSL
jgi:hypothetical protein